MIKKIIESLLILACLSIGGILEADQTVMFTPNQVQTIITPPPPISSITDQFYTSFLAHVAAVDDFRQDGSHVIKFTDGIIQAVPYQGDHLFVGSFGLIPKPSDSTKFYKSYSVHLHLISVVSKYLDINPTYAPILQSIELTPGYSYDTDQSHGGLDFSVGWVHQFGQ